ncbi:MAG: CvpA family protein [Patescibacteria group bacterium]
MNWVDAVIILTFVLYLIEGLRRGFIEQMFELFGFFLTIFLAFWTYKPLAGWLVNNVGVTQAMADPLGILIVWVFLQILFSLALRLGYPLIPEKIRTTKLNKEAGLIPAFFRALIVVAIILTLVVIFPGVPAKLKASVNDSLIGSKFVARSSQIEAGLNTIFGRDIKNSLGFITVPAQNEQIIAPNESVDLGFTTTDVTVDAQSAQKMLELINQERAKAGLKALIWDDALAKVARAHSTDMFARGYFSHTDPDGKSPFDRISQAGITYKAAGENLAYAANVELAHNGLMRSPGHRANILEVDFGRIGIGVIDGGIYGKMFTQNFRD